MLKNAKRLVIRDLIFFFSLLYQRAEDEALNKTPPDLSVFGRLANPAWSSRCFSSSDLPLHCPSRSDIVHPIFLCLLLLLFPSTCPCKAAIGSLSPSIRPNHRRLLFLNFSTSVSRAPSSSLVFLISDFFFVYT